MSQREEATEMTAKEKVARTLRRGSQVEVLRADFNPPLVGMLGKFVRRKSGSYGYIVEIEGAEYAFARSEIKRIAKLLAPAEPAQEAPEPVQAEAGERVSDDRLRRLALGKWRTASAEPAESRSMARELLSARAELLQLRVASAEPAGGFETREWWQKEARPIINAIGEISVMEAMEAIDRMVSK